MKLRISFTLKTGMTGEIPVLAILNFGYKEFDILKSVNVYKPLRYYTGIRVTKDQWDDKQKLPKNRDKQMEIFVLQKKMEDVFNYLQLKGEPITPTVLKTELDDKVKGKAPAVVVTRVRIHDFVRNEIMAEKTSLKERTLKSYGVFANKILQFEQVIGKHLYSNDVNEHVYKQFLDMQREQVNKINSLWSLDKSFRAVLNEIGRRYKVPVFKPGQDLASKDRVHSVQEDKVYLNFEQIQKVIDYVPESEKERNVKLILLTLLFTGCRESDVFKIKPDHLYEKNGLTFHWCRYISQKTNAEIIVPILKPLADAIEENGGPAYKISSQNFNSYVKELAAKCGLDEEVSLTYTDPQGKKRFEVKPFYQFVSSHIGRRSFVTNLINYVPVTILTKITGHELKDKSIIFGYNKVSLIDNAALFVRELERVQRENPEHFVLTVV